MRKEPTTRPAIARAILAARIRGAAQYKKADELLEKLLRKAKPGDQIRLGEGRVAVVIDNFLTKDGTPKNKAWKAAGITRFDLDEI